MSDIEMITKAVKEALESECKNVNINVGKMQDSMKVTEAPDLGTLVKGISDGSLMEKARAFALTHKDASDFNADDGAVLDGGALVVPQLDTEITQAVFTSPLMSLVRPIPVAQNQLYTTSVRVPTGDSNTTAAQGAIKTVSQLEFDRGTVSLRTHYWRVDMSNELLEDAPQAARVAMDMGASQISRTVENGILNGGSVGFTGIIGDAGTVPIARAVASKVSRADLDKMYAALWRYGGITENTAWVVSPSAFPEIEQLRDVYSFHLLEGNPVTTLFGYPIILSPFAATLGTKGDVVLGNFGRYALGLKTRGITSKMSTHFLFGYNQTSLLIEARMAGIPAQRTKIEVNSHNYGFFVELAGVGGTV